MQFVFRYVVGWGHAFYQVNKCLLPAMLLQNMVQNKPERKREAGDEKSVCGTLKFHRIVSLLDFVFAI